MGELRQVTSLRPSASWAGARSRPRLSGSLPGPLGSFSQTLAGPANLPRQGDKIPGDLECRQSPSGRGTSLFLWSPGTHGGDSPQAWRLESELRKALRRRCPKGGKEPQLPRSCQVLSALSPHRPLASTPRPLPSALLPSAARGTIFSRWEQASALPHKVLTYKVLPCLTLVTSLTPPSLRLGP